MSLENDGSGVATQSKASVPVLIPPGSSPPSVLESNEYLRNLTTTHLMIPTTVTDLCERKQHHNYEGIIEDLYRILAKLSAENKSLKLSLSEQQEIIENELYNSKETFSMLSNLETNENPQNKQKEPQGSPDAQPPKSKLSLGKKSKDKSKKQQQQQPQDEVVNDEDKLNAPSEERLADLTRRLEASEQEALRLSDALEQMSAQKAALERDVAALHSEHDRLRVTNDTLAAEKWELAAANTDLQNRLQAVSYMQSVPDTMLKEEVRKLHIALSDERKVTEKLSRNLELEKRRSESLEQKAKNAFRRSGASNGTGIYLPEEARYRDEQLIDKMDKYRDQIERVTDRLEECEEKLTGFEIQEEYHAADLRKELSNLKKILSDEKRRSSGDSQKLSDLAKAYQECIEQLKHSDSKAKKNDDSDHSAVGTSASQLQTKLTQALEDIRDERRRAEQLAEKVRQYQSDLETLPLLKAQLEVYQTDVNAERAAREKIAGEKADLVEELQRLRKAPHASNDIAHNNSAAARPMPEIATGSVREALHHFDADRPEAQPRAQQKTERKTFSCPKCNKAFPILTLLQNHVNACLDKD